MVKGLGPATATGQNKSRQVRRFLKFILCNKYKIQLFLLSDLVSMPRSDVINSLLNIVELSESDCVGYLHTAGSRKYSQLALPNFLYFFLIYHRFGPFFPDQKFFTFGLYSFFLNFLTVLLVSCQRTKRYKNFRVIELTGQLRVIILKVKNKLLNYLKINLDILYYYDEYKIVLPFVSLTAHRLKHPMINTIPTSSKCTIFSMKYRQFVIFCKLCKYRL